jgi:hypothetical protein
MLSYVATTSCESEDGNILAGKVNDLDPKLAPLQLSIFMVASCLLYGAEGDQRSSLAASASRLRGLLTKLVTQIELHETGIMLFPGALVWCYAIGIRFSDPERDQKWFMVQFLRTTQAWMAGAFDEMSRNSRMIVDCMERIGRLSVVGMAPGGSAPEDIGVYLSSVNEI